LVRVSSRARDTPPTRRDTARGAAQRNIRRQPLWGTTERHGPASVREGMFALDREGRLTYMDPTAEELLGWRQEELRGCSMHEAIHGHRQGGSRHPIAECPLRAVLADGKPIRAGGDVLSRKDRTLLPVAYTAGPIVTDEGIEGLVVVFRRTQARRATPPL
jgi:PAS domain S-box-containing protein